jgi:heme oxygenase
LADVPPHPTSLADRLRSATRALHQQAERSGVMAALLRGRLGVAPYTLLLRNLHAIYAALEAVFDVQPAALRRADALAHDLDALHGPHWRAQLPLAAATQAYVQRLQRTPPPPLLAHAYVRYLGDLHGGQVLQRRVSTALGVAATRFYDFGDAARVQALIAQLRTLLAAQPAAGAAADAIVDEACWSFAQHIRLFEELQPAAPAERATG